MIAAFLMLCQIVGLGSVFILLLWAVLNAVHILRDMWREHQLKQREIRQLLASISTTKAGR